MRDERLEKIYGLTLAEARTVVAEELASGYEEDADDVLKRLHAERALLDLFIDRLHPRAKEGAPDSVVPFLPGRQVVAAALEEQWEKLYESAPDRAAVETLLLIADHLQQGLQQLADTLNREDQRIRAHQIVDAADSPPENA